MAEVTRFRFCIIRYNGWLDAITKTWTSEGLHGLFKGSVPRIIWYIPASAITFMAVEFLRDHFNDKASTDAPDLGTLSIDTRPDVEEAV
jgi:radical SAM superfamily enzyme